MVSFIFNLYFEKHHAKFKYSLHFALYFYNFPLWMFFYKQQAS